MFLEVCRELLIVVLLDCFCCVIVVVCCAQIFVAIIAMHMQRVRMP